MRAFLRLTSIAVTVFAADCGSSTQPLGPTPVDEGIVFYMNANFSGPSQAVNADVPISERTGCLFERRRGGDADVGGLHLVGESHARLERDLVPRQELQRGERDADSRHAEPPRSLGPCTQSTFNDCASSIRVARRAITQ